MSNRLIREKSPYLLQHAHNPVDWYSWGDEAFAAARSQDKPVFLSIGYATCHWCHVMENESFEDLEAAGWINDTFVPVKVDREERPDIDRLYMAACQMLTGGGGWPLTIFMTPDKQPFFAATYIPRSGRFGRPGLIELCRQVKSLWSQRREDLLKSAGDISGSLSAAFSFSSEGRPDEGVLDRAYKDLAERFDAELGGFGTAPKFPTPHQLLFLLRRHHRTGDDKALSMVRNTLSAMRMGGIWDHLGFGFHRYSTDRRWLLPHFEKMLYDQALIALACLETFQVTGDSRHARTAEEIFTYVLRDMTSPEGGFYAAEDADSEGEEGKYYVWTAEEFHKILGKEEAALWEKVFNVALGGNFEDEATRQKTGANILHLTQPFSVWAEKLGIPETDLFHRWDQARERLFMARRRRVPPLKDDKILTDWNGLMIAALALGARVLGKMAYAGAAEKAAGFILDRLRDENGRLLHRFREQEAAIPAFAEDYACMIMGLLSLYRTDFDPANLEAAVSLQERMLLDFWDEEKGGFFTTARDTGELPVRPKDLQDGAMPSANSVSLNNLLELSRTTGDSRWEEKAWELMEAFSGSVGSHPSAYTHFLLGIDFALYPGREVVISGNPESPDTVKLLAALNRSFSPGSVALFKTDRNEERLSRIAAFTRGLNPVEGRATAHICKGFSCKEPTTDPDDLLKKLLEKR